MKKLSKTAWIILIIFYISIFTNETNVLGNYLLQKRINIKGIAKQEHIIAVIDIAFDLTNKHKNAIKPFNAHTKTHNVTNEIKFTHPMLLNEAHGTSIINIFIGKNGLAPNAKIIPIQVYDEKDLPAALEYAIKNKAKIINISLTFHNEDKPLQCICKDALLKASKHAKIFIAAGNEGKALEETSYGKSMIKLANMSNGQIFLVAATQFTPIGEKLAPFTNYAITPYGKQVLLFAPGSKIRLDGYISLDKINSVSGTSIATPIMIAKYLIDQENSNQSK